MTPTATTPRRRNGATGPSRRAGLDRDEVVDAALALVEEEGPGSLTMRRLASELGVTATTVVWHVGTRDELVAAVIARLSQRLADRPVTGDTPVERVLCAARHVRDSALAHRHVTALAHQVGATSLLELPLEVALARELEAAGLRGAAVRDALRAVLMCVAGFLVVELRPPDSVPEPYRHQVLWDGVADTGLQPATLRALRRPPAMRSLFESTLRAVVESVVPGGGAVA